MVQAVLCVPVVALCVRRTITREKLKSVELAEQLLLDLGFRQVRVRVRGDIARVEVLAEDIHRLVEDATRKTV
ncbi:MAG: hypothetical protein FWE20_10285 [Defluviitaleaceae bacterium]|nr:hypothetical protein [Defluviitaleaceae bacterium]